MPIIMEVTWRASQRTRYVWSSLAISTVPRYFVPSGLTPSDLYTPSSATSWGLHTAGARTCSTVATAATRSSLRIILKLPSSSWRGAGLFGPTQHTPFQPFGAAVHARQPFNAEHPARAGATRFGRYFDPRTQRSRP